MSVRLVILLVAICACSWSGSLKSQTLPRYEVSQVTSKLEIDGQLKERAWAEAPPLRAFVNNRDGSPTKLSTEAKILYDQNFIYFAFRSDDTNVWSTMKKRDEHLWLEEVVEVFLQADPSIPNYIELEVNPLGTMLDIYLINTRKPLHYESWNSENLRWGVSVDGTVDGKENDRGWSCEIALPFQDIATAPHMPPLVGDKWRLNLYRVEKLPTSAELAWSPTLQDDFHVLPKLGEIVFTDRKVPQP